MARRDVEKEFADRVRQTLKSFGELERNAILTTAASYDIPETRALAMAEFVRKRSAQTQKPGLPPLEPSGAFMERKFPEARWLVKDLLPANVMGAIAAPSFVGKTLVAIYAAVAAARLGWRVAYVLEEGTGEDFQQRLRAAGWTPDLSENLVVLFQASARIDTPEWVAHWKEQLQGYDAAFFDTFSDVTECDQLEPSAMIAVFKQVRSIRIVTGCTICILMHSPKAVFRGDTPPSLADVFGSVVAVNHLDFIHLLRTMREDDEEVDGKVELHCRKLRGVASKPPPPRAGEVVTHELGDDKTTASFRLIDGVSPSEAKLQARTERYRDRVLAFVRDNRVSSVTQLADEMGGKTAHVKRAAKDLLSIGTITIGKSGFLEVVPVRSLAVPANPGNGSATALSPVPSGVPIKAPGNGGTGARPHSEERDDSGPAVPDQMGTDWKSPDDGNDT